MKKYYKSLFLSDIHLGYPLCRTSALNNLLDEIDFDELYLVGDIIDLWYLQKNQLHLLDPNHIELFDRLLSYSLNGKKVCYIYGNHDDTLSNPRLKDVLSVSGIMFADHIVYTTMQGKKYSVLHGDEFDIVNFGQNKAPSRILGDMIFQFGTNIDIVQTKLRKVLGFSYWSLMGFAAERIRYQKINRIGMSSLDFFENAVSYDALKRGFDGVICGHVHIPSSKIVQDVHYLNTGDWVKSCTALVETLDGDLEMLKLNDKIQIRKQN
jgi:UDP-2,3-diacylglucosamine pyrophosphatase LpxH